MPKPTNFLKIQAGGRDVGDSSKDGRGVTPVIQKSASVSAFGSTRIGVVPAGGADLLEILTLVDVAVGGSAGAVTLDFGTSANASAFGVVHVTNGVGRYLLPRYVAGTAAASLDVHVSGSNFQAIASGTPILVAVTSASGGSTTAPTLNCYTTWLMPFEAR